MAKMTKEEREALRAGEESNKQRLARLKAELAAIDRERPESKREMTERAWHLAMARSSEVGKGLDIARRELNAHLAAFTVDMTDSELRSWAVKRVELEAIAEALADQWRAAERAAERARQVAADARREPSEERQRIWRKIDTLQAELGLLNWKEQAGPRGQEILSELQELHRLINPPMFATAAT